jgi:tetratricopeptide (TPR) repeat protein
MSNSVDKDISLLQAAVHANPENLPLQLNLMSAYLKEEYYSKFLNEFENLIKLFPNWPQFHYDLLLKLYQFGYAGAIRKVFEDAIKHDFNNYIFFYCKGIIQQIGHEQDSAIESYKKAIKTEPSFASAYLNIGITYMNNKDEENKATEYLEEAKSQYHRLAEAYFFLGIVNQSFDQITAGMYFDSFIDYAYPYLANSELMDYAKEQVKIGQEQFSDLLAPFSFQNQIVADDSTAEHDKGNPAIEDIMRLNNEYSKKWWQFWKR